MQIRPTEVIIGAGAGALLAAVCLLIGALRFVVALFLALFTGAQIVPLTASDLRMLGFYVGGFILGGAAAGLVRAFSQGRIATYVGCTFGGMIVMLAIAIGDTGWAKLDRFHWIAAPALGAIFGIGFAHFLIDDHV